MADQVNSLEELGQVAEGTAEAVVEVAAPREPVRDELGRSYATGKRKDAVARVWIKPGSCMPRTPRFADDPGAAVFGRRCHRPV